MDFLNDVLTILGYLGYVWVLLKWLYDNKINFFIKINKIFSWKKDVNFELLINSSSDNFNLNYISSIFNQNKHIDYRVLSRNSTRIVIQFDTMNVEIVDNSDDPESEMKLIINFINTSSTYSTAIKKIKIIGDIIEDIEKSSNVTFNKFQFSSKFKNSNPFISRSIGTAGLDDIKQFMMIIGVKSINEIDDNIDADLNIGKSNISFVDNRFSNIKLISEVILAI